ncbi:tellurite resistance TerB family protein [Microcoleus sp. herbarium12]|uniref:tellurite resistance TerB family protein n=1 Tax=Microcoleus sp. herbarium12 TaxID=3055437 RepID=UPI002FD5F05E
MGNFDKIFNSDGKSKASLTLEESVAAVSLVAAEANSPDADADILESILWDSEIFAEYSEDDMSAMFQKLAAIIREDGLGALFNTAWQSMPDELVLDTFAITAAMFVADGEVSQKHLAFLQEFQQVLGVEDEEAEEIIEDVVAAYSQVEDVEPDLDVEEPLYVSPEGNFSVVIPVDEAKGGRIDEEEGSVTFSDDFGILLRIDYFPIAGEVEELIESAGESPYLTSFLNNFIEGEVMAKFAKSQVLYTEYLEDEEAYFVLVDLPGGATVSVEKNDGSLNRIDAYRGFIAFIAEDFCYTISCQRIYQDKQELGSLEAEVEEMMNKIFEFIETVEFSPLE